MPVNIYGYNFAGNCFIKMQMKIRTYNKYILKSLASSTVFITVSLTTIVWLTQSLKFIDLIVNRGLPVSTFLYLTMLLLPSLLGVILPIALFIAAIFTYHRLIMDSEMVVLESSGLSKLDLSKPVIIIASIISGIGYLISFYLLPVSYREFKDLQSFIRDNYASILLQEEVFNNPIDGLTVFIRERKSGSILRRIFVHDNRNPENPVTMMAEEGKLIQTPSGPKFLLLNGNRQEVDNKNGQLSILNFESYNLDLNAVANPIKDRGREPEERFVGELLNPENGISENVAAKFAAEAHQRMTWPLLSFALSLIAISALLCGEFNRRGQWRKITYSVGIAIAAVGLCFFYNNITGRYPSMFIMQYINMIILIAIPIYYLKVSENFTKKI